MQTYQVDVPGQKLRITVDEQSQRILLRLEPDPFSSEESLARRDELLDFTRASEIAWRDVQKAQGISVFAALLENGSPFLMDYETETRQFGNLLVFMARQEAMPPTRAVEGISHKVTVQLRQGKERHLEIALIGRCAMLRECEHELLVHDPFGMLASDES